MSMQVTLTLSNELYETASRWATLTQRDLTRTLTDALTVVLSPRYVVPAQDRPVSALSDAEVLALGKAKMNSVAGRRMSELLEKQREGALEGKERQELMALMQAYDRLWIRQSAALAEAVRRGLREPLAA
jgi:hypothetical protein